MDVEFCDKCENLLYLFIDNETTKMVLKCKSCGNQTEMGDKVIEINNNTTINVDKSDVINSNPFITHDITLPSIKDNHNIKCQNSECDAEEINIKYIKYDDVNMKYLYICNNCGFKWKNSL
jgi:DNA-directed RNA polymerase subunit M/transcription elongation factor TFIIS